MTPVRGLLRAYPLCGPPVAAQLQRRILDQHRHGGLARGIGAHPLRRLAGVEAGDSDQGAATALLDHARGGVLDRVEDTVEVDLEHAVEEGRVEAVDRPE